MIFRVFWNVSPCSHVEVDRLFRGAIRAMIIYYGLEDGAIEVRSPAEAKGFFL
jgi:hypothetical protein